MDEKCQLGPWAVGCVLVNANMGMGFLTLPYAFYQAGLLASAAVLLCQLFVAVVTARCLVDVMAHANAVKLRRPSVPTGVGTGVHERTPLSGAPGQTSVVTSTVFSTDAPVTMAELVEIFYGPRMRVAVMFTMQVTAYVTMVGYGALVGSSIAETVDFPVGSACNVYHSAACMPRYRLILILFTVLGVALTALDVKEQISFQICMTMGRAFVALVIVGESLRLMSSSTPLTSTQYPSGQPDNPSFFATDFTKLPQVIALSSFAMGMNFLIPELVRDLGEKPSFLGLTVDGALFACGLIYVVVAFVVSLAFGSQVLPLCTLNFSGVRGLPGILQKVLILLPVADVIASYPLYGHAFASNLQQLLIEHLGRSHAPPLLVTRIFCGASPLLVSWFVFDVSLPAAWIGIGFCFCSYCLPVILWPRATAEAERIHTFTERNSNPYKVEISRALLVFAGVCAFTILVFAVQGAVSATSYPESESAALLMIFSNNLIP
jgi:amino acid permease